MNKTCFISFMLSLVVSSCTTGDNVDMVNPFIGTLHEGHCYPGAAVPMGMVQPSPETTRQDYPGYGMDHCAGYQYDDPFISGFAQTHINGAGCPSLSDILLMPYCARTFSGNSRDDYSSRYDKDSEAAVPGFYSVDLTDNHVKVALTASEHAAFHHYDFKDANSAHLLVDLQYGVHWLKDAVHDNVAEAWHEIGKNSLAGFRRATEWTSRDLYYYIECDCDFSRYIVLPAPDNADEKASRILFTFPEGTETLNVKIGLSTTSVEAARQNMVSEIGSSDFSEVKHRARKAWENILSRIIAEGRPEMLHVLYTSLYHLYLQPNNIADCDGRYRTAEGEVRSAESGRFLSTLSLWDTYRAAHPMYTILTPSLVPDMCSSIMDHYRTRPVEGNPPHIGNRYLPRWALWGKETNTMIGNHAVPVLVDAFLKGLYPADASSDELYEAVHTTLTKNHYRHAADVIAQYGYLPYDVEPAPYNDCRETVSRLLEGSYDFHCADLLARRLAQPDTTCFHEHSMDYRNVYDPESGFFCGRDSKGNFRAPEDPTRVVGEWMPKSDYTEGNSYHYLFHVQHDIPGLIGLMGGKDVFRTKLDTMFYGRQNKPYVKDLVWNIYGTLGQYWHGNEPCHHVPYLYKFTGQGYKTDAIIHYLVKNFSRNKPDGLKGNDDCGQMSAWYLFSVMGFYPVDPCSGEFVLGAPQLPYVKINLENGNVFEIVAHHLSEQNIFVRQVSLNGKPVTGPVISYDDIMNGGRLEFEMVSREDVDELMDFLL